MQMLLAFAPGIFLMADASVESGNNLTDDTLIKLNHTAKFAMVRKEAFNMGYYQNGDQPSTPVSPVDGSGYEAEECLFVPVFVSASAPSSGLIPGQAAFPALAPFLSGNPIVMPYIHQIDPTTGRVDERVYTDRGSQNLGVAQVLVFAQRLSVPQPPPAQLAVGILVTVSGSTSVGGSNFNGIFPVTAVSDEQDFQYFQPGLGADAGGGGTISFSYPAVTASIVASPNGLVRDTQGTVYVRLATVPH
jgi:hypothetical protein